MTNTDARLQTIFVAIPVYNGAPYIGQAIQSLISQSYPHWRLTVYDNASTDATREVVQSFNDKRITLAVIDKTVAVWDNWNRCLSEVKGDFFQLLCADDALHPSCFEEKIMLAEKPENAAITIFSSNRNLMSAKGKMLFVIGYSRRLGVFSRDEVIRAVVSKTNPIGDPATGLTRTAALSDIQGFSADYPFMVDLDFWLQVLEKGDMLHTPAVLSYFRISGGALSGSQFFQNCSDYVRFYRRRIKPHFNDRLMLYYWGYLCFAGRALMRQAVYFVNR